MQDTELTACITVEEYLRDEEHSSIRHEYVDGRVFAMSGGTLNHARIVGNIYSLLRNHLRGGSCSAYLSDVKVRVEATNSIYYPDLKVACGNYKGDEVMINDPVLLVEVLSRSTAKIDRREKYYAYKHIPTLKEYLIVDQRRRRLELYRKNDQGEWDLIVATSSTIILESMPAGPLTMPLDEIYESVDFPTGGDLLVREDEEEYYLD